MKYKMCQSGLRWLWVAVVVFALDQLSKYLVVTHLIAYEPIQLTNFFNLTLAYNRGAAFSFLNNAAGWQTWLFSGLALIVTVVILMRLKQAPYQQRWISIAFSMIIGGAMGNLTDRAVYGHVIDFIQWHVSNYYWPVFNLADSAICVGAVMLFLDIIFRPKNS